MTARPDHSNTGRLVTIGLWACAAIVMVSSARNGALSFQILGESPIAGFALGVAVDVALAVALVGDRALHLAGRFSRWGRALRITTCLMSGALNCAVYAWLGQLGIAAFHSFLTILLVLLTEYAQDFTLQSGEIEAEHDAAEQAERDRVQAETDAAAEAQRRETQRLADEQREREAADRAEREREREQIAALERERRAHETAQLTGAFAAVSLAKRVGKRPARRTETPAKPKPRPKARDELGAKRSEHTTTAIDAAILAAWDRGERPTGGQLDRAHGTNNYARSRLALLRKQHPGREPETAAQA